MPLNESRLRTLVLYADYTTRLSFFDDWLDALVAPPGFETRALNICQRGALETIRSELAEADLTILLHSTNGDTTVYLEPFAGLLADRRGKLVSFIGNEVSLPGSPLSTKRALLARIGPDFVATQLRQEAGDYLWGDLVKSRVLTLPHALNPTAFRPVKSDAERDVDIGVRAVQYGAQLGDDDRNRVHDLFATHAFAPDLRVDISHERFDREGWAAFLNRCRGTVSTEAGTWFLERDDETVTAIRAWMTERFKGGIVIANDSPLRKLGHKLPWWLRAALRKLLSHGPLRHESTLVEALDFQEVHERFFKGRPIPAHHGKCISSRHFDAIGTGTCQILLEGTYNGILAPGEHYIQLDRDFGNIAEVMAIFADPDRRQRIATRALDHVLAHHTYAHRVAALHEAVVAG